MAGPLLDRPSAKPKNILSIVEFLRPGVSSARPQVAIVYGGAERPPYLIRNVRECFHKVPG